MVTWWSRGSPPQVYDSAAKIGLSTRDTTSMLHFIKAESSVGPWTVRSRIWPPVSGRRCQIEGSFLPHIMIISCRVKAMLFTWASLLFSARIDLRLDLGHQA